MLIITLYYSMSRDNESIEDHDYESFETGKMNQPSAYEYIDILRAPPPQRWSSPVGQFELTQCAAYTPTTHGNLQEEAETAFKSLDKHSTAAVATREGQIRNMEDS